MEVSIRFNVSHALARATQKNWSINDWADEAGCSPPTIRAFLSGDPKLKITTVESILRPLGIRAYDIIVTPPPALPTLSELPTRKLAGAKQ